MIERALEHSLHRPSTFTQVADHAVDVLLDGRIQVVTHPRVALELVNVGGLVQGQPEAELPTGQAKLGLNGSDVGLDEVEQAGISGSSAEQADVVLAENPA